MGKESILIFIFFFKFKNPPKPPISLNIVSISCSEIPYIEVNSEQTKILKTPKSKLNQLVAPSSRQRPSVPKRSFCRTCGTPMYHLLFS